MKPCPENSYFIKIGQKYRALRYDVSAFYCCRRQIAFRVMHYRAVNGSGRGINTMVTRSSVALYVHCLSVNFLAI